MCTRLKLSHRSGWMMFSTEVSVSRHSDREIRQQYSTRSNPGVCLAIHGVSVDWGEEMGC